MAPKLPEFYAVDGSANFIDTNAKTQTDVLYVERDTGKLKLGNGERYCDVEYLTPSTDVNIDADIVTSIDKVIAGKIAELSFEAPIDKKSAFNKEFGETVDTVARGKHKHDVSDINNLKLPRGVNYPESPTGKSVLFDNGDFGSIESDTIPAFNSKNPISSSWAAQHEMSGGHVSPAMTMMTHEPMQAVGSGIVNDGQTIRLLIGRGTRDVCPGVHEHDEYAKRAHVHTDRIASSRLPNVSKESAGAVPPTGNPSGRVLHDDGSWKYAQSLTTVVIDDYWIAPASGQLTFVHVSSQEPVTAILHMNSGILVKLEPISAKIHGFYEAKKELSIPFKAGDIFQVSGATTQLGILYQR